MGPPLPQRRFDGVNDLWLEGESEVVAGGEVGEPAFPDPDSAALDVVDDRTVTAVHAELALDRDDDAALGGAVELGQHDAGDVHDLADEAMLYATGPVYEVAPEDERPGVGPVDFLSFHAVYQGSRDAAEAAFAPLAALPGVQGGFETQSYETVQIGNGTLPFGLRHYWKGHLLRDIDPAAAAAIVAGIRSRPNEHSFLLLEAMTGQARREPEGGAAFGQRGARWNVSALAIWEDPAEDARQIAWARQVADSIAPASYSGAGYANYASYDESDTRVRAAYGPERFARLQAIKRRYDPDNVFRFNLNVPPG